MKSLSGNASSVKLVRGDEADTISKRGGRYAAGSVENAPSRSDLHSQFQQDQIPERPQKGSKLVSKLFNSKKKSQMPLAQLLPSAEAGPLRVEARGLEEQVAHFKQVYSKVGPVSDLACNLFLTQLFPTAPHPQDSQARNCLRQSRAVPKRQLLRRLGTACLQLPTSSRRSSLLVARLLCR